MAPRIEAVTPNERNYGDIYTSPPIGVSREGFLLQNTSPPPGAPIAIGVGVPRTGQSARTNKFVIITIYV